jgi:hypothetical protein
VIGGVGESGVPASVVVGEGVVEDSGADLEQQVGPAGAPAHLLLFDHAFADDLVDGGLDERGGDGLTGAESGKNRGRVMRTSPVPLGLGACG